MTVRANFNLLSTSLLLACITTLAVGWTVDYALAATAWPVRMGLVGACALLAGVAVALQWSKQSRQDKFAQRYLDMLCRLDTHDLGGVTLAEFLPSLGDDSPWQGIFTRVRDCIQSYNDRLKEAEHARARAEVRARRTGSELEQVSAILAGLSDPVVAIDHYDEVILSNPCAERVLDFHLENAESRALAQLIHCETLIGLLTDTRRRKTPTQRTGEVTLTEAGGAPRTYRVTCRSLGNGGDGDAQRGAVAVLNDITNEKVIQKRNAEFVSAVSHEMKTPLSSIKAYVELLADGDAEDEQTRDEFLGVIGGQADRLQRLVENLLNLARIEAGVVEVNKEPRSLNELLTEVFNLMQPTAQQKNITLACDLSPLYLGVLADRDMLMQAAMNLLSNAIKYTHPGGKVTLRSRQDDRDVVFEVEDTGVGLNAEDCDKVFEKFYRVSKDKSMAPGTGLGLPLAKHIVEDVHGGRLTLKSELGRGSIFRITLPNAGRMNE